jgi:emopamil binding protein
MGSLSTLEVAMKNQTIPFSQRRVDWIFVSFFLINLFFITYIVDIEQLIVPNPSHFQQPLWPPASMVKLIHAYGSSFDPLLMARPQWWKMTIWIDVLFYGPFYVLAIYAFVKGKDWIRIPAIFYSGMMFADVFIILGEEFAGPHAAPNFPFVLALNLPWLLVPIFLTLRLRKEHPFAQTAELISPRSFDTMPMING